jgi:hypothetical protein
MGLMKRSRPDPAVYYLTRGAKYLTMTSRTTLPRPTRREAAIDAGRLREQLVRIIDVRLVDPLEILLEGDQAIEPVRGALHRRIDEWVERMLAGDDRVAVGTIARVISTLYPGDTPFDPPAEWWRTPLGQVVARRVGHPGAQAVPYPVAGAMLGITRQGVHDLIKRNKLRRHPGGGVAVESVRARLNRSPTT